MHDARAFRARVDRVLHEHAREETAQLVAVSEQLKPVADQLTTAVAEGKRLRAAFCYWGWRAAGQPDSDAVVRAAAAMELVHAAAVVHDDLIDESATRRGAPTAHIALRTAIGEPGRREAGGRALALMVGDLLLSWAGQLFTSCGLPGAYLARARPLWAVLARELVAGECLEILGTGAAARAERSLEIIRFKTAKYTVEHPLQIGGALGGAPARTLAAFSAYGLPLGEAFQLRDDLLGVFGDPAVTGKSDLDDLRGHKPTVLVAIALAGAGETDRKELTALLGRPDLDAADLRTARGVIERSGARRRVESMIEERASAARTAIARAQLPPDAAQALGGLVSALVARDA
ncbi:polyprenyl synthetase family protein [Kitasatospora sp. NPDC002040]|uniref:polyprenyl synthetase family protein n=1 Tax=Kitasatospora sp. NPDC002040 TaxID=3154661 RepID=UPI0033302C4C